MELMDCIFARRSGRNYTDEKISEEVIHSVLEAGLLAPSSRNLKSTRMILTSQEDDLTFLSQAKAAGAAMVKHASHAVIVIGNSQLSDAWIEDASITMTLMMLRATELGIANCWVQCRNRYSAVPGKDGPRSAEELIREHFDISPDYSVLAVLALGIPARAEEPHSHQDADFGKVQYC